MNRILRQIRQRWEQRLAAKRRREYDYKSAIAPIHATSAEDLVEQVRNPNQQTNTN